MPKKSQLTLEQIQDIELEVYNNFLENQNFRINYNTLCAKIGCDESQQNRVQEIVFHTKVILELYHSTTRYRIKIAERGTDRSLEENIKNIGEIIKCMVIECGLLVENADNYTTNKEVCFIKIEDFVERVKVGAGIEINKEEARLILGELYMAIFFPLFEYKPLFLEDFIKHNKIEQQKTSIDWTESNDIIKQFSNINNFLNGYFTLIKIKSLKTKFNEIRKIKKNPPLLSKPKDKTRRKSQLTLKQIQYIELTTFDIFCKNPNSKVDHIALRAKLGYSESQGQNVKNIISQTREILELYCKSIDYRKKIAERGTDRSSEKNIELIGKIVEYMIFECRLLVKNKKRDGYIINWEANFIKIEDFIKRVKNGTGIEINEEEARSILGELYVTIFFPIFKYEPLFLEEFIKRNKIERQKTNMDWAKNSYILKQFSNANDLFDEYFSFVKIPNLKSRFNMINKNLNSQKKQNVNRNISKQQFHTGDSSKVFNQPAQPSFAPRSQTLQQDANNYKDGLAYDPNGKTAYIDHSSAKEYLQQYKGTPIQNDPQQITNSKINSSLSHQNIDKRTKNTNPFESYTQTQPNLDPQIFQQHINDSNVPDDIFRQEKFSMGFLKFFNEYEQEQDMDFLNNETGLQQFENKSAHGQMENSTHFDSLDQNPFTPKSKILSSLDKEDDNRDTTTQGEIQQSTVLYQSQALQPSDERHIFPKSLESQENLHEKDLSKTARGGR